MGLSYKVTELPTTLREGEFAVVDGVVYVGNSANEPQAVGGSDKGYFEHKAELYQSGTSAPTNKILFQNDAILQGTWSRLSAGVYYYTFNESIDFDKLCVLTNVAYCETEEAIKYHVYIIKESFANRLTITAYEDLSLSDGVISNPYFGIYTFHLQYFP